MRSITARAIVAVFFGIVSLFVLGSLSALDREEVIPSYRYMMVYGYGDLQVGDRVEFFTPAGVLCGRWLVEDEGIYGLTAIYGDDPMTPDLVEGALPGEAITVRINGEEISPAGGLPIWEESQESIQINL